MTKTHFCLFFLLFAFLLPASATKGAHGGVTVVCRSPQGHIQSVELLDLWEWNKLAEKAPHWKVLPSPIEDTEVFLQSAFRKLEQGNPILAHKVREAYKTVRKVETRLPGDVRLPELTDTDVFYRPPQGCFLEQLASYDVHPMTGEEVLTVEPEVFSMLNGQQKAAFYLHEAIYKTYRDSYDSYLYLREGSEFRLGDTSRMTRWMVGSLFSPLVFEPVNALAASAHHCQGRYFEFLFRGSEIWLQRIGMELPTKAQGLLKTENQTPNGLAVEFHTNFNPLGGKLTMRIQTANSPLQYRVVSTGAMLNVSSDLIECSSPLQPSMENP